VLVLLACAEQSGRDWLSQPGVRLGDQPDQHNAGAILGGATVLTKAEMPVACSDNEPGVINSSVYAGGLKVADVAIEEAGDWSKRPGHVVWIGLFEPSDELLQRVQQQFDLHPLAIEDAGKAHQHPKLEQYGDGIFIVARTAQMVEGRIAFGETHLFVGRGYVISVRHGASVSYAAVRQRCEACPTVLSQGEDYIVYAILDFIVDNYMPVVEKIQAEVEAIEDTVLATTLSQPDIERLYMLRRD
jgi:magnesium transporter